MKKKLWILVILQCLFLLFVAGQHYSVVLWGKEILLKTAPVDPRDPFRGDYARLGYEISRIPVPNEATDCKKGCKVFVLLEKQGDFHVYKDASFSDKFSPTENQVVIEGRTSFFPGIHEKNMNVSYGIEQVFVEEGLGKALEDVNANVTVAVKVWNGRAVLDRVYLNGKLYK